MEEPRSREEVVLIGPSRAGKSTIAALLAEALDIPHMSLDALKWRFFAELGFDEAAGQQLRQREGFRALTLHLKPYAIALVERVLTENHGCIFDFGAGHTLYDEPEQVARIRRALRPFRHVVLVMPSPNLDHSVRVLQARFGPWIDDGTPFFDFPRHEVEHPLTRSLATRTLYTEGRSPESCRTELLETLRSD